MAVTNNSAAPRLDPFARSEALQKEFGAKGAAPTEADMLELQRAMQEETQYAQQLNAVGISDISAFKAAGPEQRATMFKDAVAKRNEEAGHKMLMNVLRDIG